jgi:hypothetical protein
VPELARKKCRAILAGLFITQKVLRHIFTSAAWAKTIKKKKKPLVFSN